MLEFRNYSMVADSATSRETVFRMGAGLFAVQHILMICQFGMWFKYPRPYSYFVYAGIIVILYIMHPFCPKEMFIVTVIYGLILGTSFFMSLNAMSYPHSLPFERTFAYGVLSFLISDSVLLASEINLIPMPDGYQRKIMHPIVMITYYAAQILFANGSMGVYEFNRRRFKIR